MVIINARALIAERKLREVNAQVVALIKELEALDSRGGTANEIKTITGVLVDCVAKRDQLRAELKEYLASAVSVRRSRKSKKHEEQKDEDRQ